MTHSKKIILGVMKVFYFFFKYLVMDLLKDPSNDRVVKTLKPPPHRHLDRKLMFPDRLKGRDHGFKVFRQARLETFKRSPVEGGEIG